MPDIESQLRAYADLLGELYPDVAFEELIDEAAPLSAQHRPRNGVVVAVAAATLILATAGLLGFVLFSTDPVAVDQTLPPSTLPDRTGSDWFLGSWVPENVADGSVTLEVRPEGDGDFVLELLEENASRCDGPPGTTTGSGRVTGDNEVAVSWGELRCEDATSRAPLPDTTFRWDQERGVLVDSTGVIWLPVQPDPSLFRWRGYWPQSDLAAVAEAQTLADEGNPSYEWQVERSTEEQGFDAGSAVATRYLHEELGWSNSQQVGGAGGEDYVELAYIRCQPGTRNPLYPGDPNGANCAPTLDELHYETVKLRLQQPLRQGPGGLWVITAVDELADSNQPLDGADWTSRQYEQIVPPTEDEVSQFVEEFLEARVSGEGAESYLAATAQGLPNQTPVALYETTTGSRYEAAELVQVYWGPMWPDGSYYVGVRLSAAEGSQVVEQDFRILVGESGQLVIDYSLGGGTENGAPIPVPYGIGGGEITFMVPEPWYSPWMLGITEGEESILGGENANLVFLSDARLAAEDCSPGPPRANAEDLVESIVSNPDLESYPTAVLVAGRPATQILVDPVPAAVQCESDDGFTGGVPVIWHGDDNPHPWGVPHGERMIIYLLDFQTEDGTETLTVILRAEEEFFEAAQSAAQPIIDSIQIDTGE